MTRHDSRTRPSRSLPVRAPAKINLTLRVLGTRADGYHELRTVFQTVALHDTVTVAAAGPRAPLTLTCTLPGVPCDDRNLAWKAARALWQTAGRPGVPTGVAIHIAKRIPMEAGLGGGSSDAAATLRGLARLWRLRLTRGDLALIGARIGADVPFFLWGGTALGLDRGDRIYPLADLPPAWVVLLLPAFGVSTVEAYRWHDRWAAEGQPAPARQLPAGWALPGDEGGNDLESPVAARHPEIGAMTAALGAAGATYAAMSGSGSAVFGLFAGREAAERAARRCGRAGWRALVTRTTGRLRWK
ncbi:MAG TPA: 4-(cytidine 5'-diphospho)-2-C-methyl-D-erythritol kinase [Vicinamibacterales bacterium]|nr:4-(cytidine 5'-diphospho)-2-C-methyl-D-erythritol kinase [Vicinamibacterales bacterium]